MRPDVAAYHDRLSEIPGWFPELDFRVFDFLLADDRRGDLLEIGAYRGASAILLGLHRGEGETFTVCDLFGAPAPADDNQAENARYAGLTRRAFERDYLTFVAELPVIVEASSLDILGYVRPQSCRFVHVDGCHLYDYVRSDLESSAELTTPDGMIACDDWRGAHTPGVTAAVLERVIAGELHPIAITPEKFYGSWNADVAEERCNAVHAWAEASPSIGLELHTIRGTGWLRLWEAAPPTLAEKSGFLLRHPHLLRRRLQRLVRRTA